MFEGWLLLLVSMIYLGLLFMLAYIGDLRPLYPARTWLRPVVYSLALAVYCTSWTFYGAVGTAVSSDWMYLPIYLGPILLFLVFGGFFRRVVTIAHERKITSIADFIASRYGKSQSLAVLVTLIALTAAVPYVALQFKAVALSIDVLTNTAGRADGPWLADTAFYVAALLALFAILFGTRKVDATEHHHGLMLAVAAESLVKLVAFVAAGFYAWGLLGDEQLAGMAATVLPLRTSASFGVDFLTHTLLAMLAIFCLPRQFQVGVVECENPDDVRVARWAFPAYLIVFSVLIIPIALAGLAFAPASGVHPDSFVLWLPASRGEHALSLLIFLGGFSAATGMVIVSSVALATMVSNELVLPALSRIPWLRLSERGDLKWLVLWVRRAAILVLALLAFAYYRLSSSVPSLASVGLLSFAAVAQFAPAIVAGLYFRSAGRLAATCGLIAGFAVWLYTLFLPTLSGAGFLSDRWLSEGPLGIEALRPHALLGLDGLNPVTHGTLWSLGANMLVFALVSLRRRANMAERLHARSFLDLAPIRPLSGNGFAPARARVGELADLAARILGAEATARGLAEHARERGRPLSPEAHADRAFVQHLERLLAGALGATSARLMLTGALRGTGMELDEVAALLDETSAELRFNRELLQATMENVSQGISVVDSQMQLVAWNRRYLELFDYPVGMVYVGRPVSDLIRFNAERGECGPGEVEAHIERRIAHMQRGTPHVFQRIRPNGMVLEMRGQPMPGGFVTTFTDVTDYKRVEQELREATEQLELRVAQRTAELAEAVDAQREAKQEAEAANLSKSRFLAATGHDLMQPLNAARLFLAALRQDVHVEGEAASLAARVDNSLAAAEELLAALLDISRLERGVLKPEITDFALGELIDSLRDQFAAQAAERHLDLRCRSTRVWVRSDKHLLRRILQNFLANAVRYTRRGSILLGLRRRGDEIEIVVADTGPGIPAEHRTRIFGEFERVDTLASGDAPGLGLGLAIVDRSARTLGHRLQLRSELGHGSAFSIHVPRAEPSIQPAAPRQPSLADLPRARVLCLDNEPGVLEAMHALLTRWGLQVDLARSPAEALEKFRANRPDVVLADYHLDNGDNGLDTLQALGALVAGGPPGALLTADTGEALREQARTLGVPLLSKPVKPGALRALLDSLLRRA